MDATATDYCKLGKYDFSEMELKIKVCNRKVKCGGSLKASVNLLSYMIRKEAEQKGW